MTETRPDTGFAAPVNSGLSADSIARYVQGAPPEMAQYAFFIGNWDCELRAHPPGDAPPVILRGEWKAKWVHDGRMLVDDLSVFLPGGEEALGWLNLRTFCEETGCWEISGHRALAASSGAITHGHWREGEMHLDFETRHAGQVLENFVRFRDITDTSFEWDWRHRAESGGDWNLFAAISARRRS